MPALILTKQLSEELTELIGRLGVLILHGEGLTAEEVRDLRSWLQAARARHHEELRETRGRRWQAAIIDFSKRAGAGQAAMPSEPPPRGEDDEKLSAFFGGEDVTPCA